ncbi:MAG: pilus assembly protein TadG-related protein [Henriciella sp.]|nr:pilus assembly protein TadG-related protein [Henriciella sp.]
MMKSASQAQRRLKKDVSGNVAMIVAIAVIPLAIVAGFAIDYQLVTTKKTKAQFSLDAAILAGSRMMQANLGESEVKLGVQDYFSSVMLSNEGALACEPLEVTINDQDISAATLCSQATTLSALAGVTEMKFSVNSASKFGTGMVDVAFVFDVSGSMQGARMASLKDAAKIAVEQLLPENPPVGHEDDIRLSAVSYNNSLNAGDFFENCTPGYYNNEGQMSERSVQNGFYGGGSIEFFKILEDWREEGSLDGLELR